MSPIARPHPPEVESLRTRAAVAGLVAAVGSTVVVEIVALIGKAAGAAHVNQLTPAPLAVLTILGVAIATTVWVLIGRRPDGGKLLRALVPAVLIVSILPDLALRANNTPWGAVITLIIAHVSVFAVTVPILIARLPPRTSVTGD